MTRRYLLAALGLLAANAIALECRSTPTHPQTRVAIRVACDDAHACTLAESRALDVWSEHRAPGMPLDIVVTDATLADLRGAGIEIDVLVPDIDEVAAAEAERLRDPQAAQPADWFAEYRDYASIGARLEELARSAPERARLLAIGGSVEGRPIWALRIGNGSTSMLVNGTQHAREWIAAMTTTCVAERLVREYDANPAVRAFVDTTELWIIPVANPDGYQQTWAGDRYWRKNRKGRHGVDLNRNFSVAWGGSGSSRNERSETYRGEYAFSEPESSALRDLAMRERFAFHIDFHSYGQMVLHPWAYTGTPTKDQAQLRANGDRLASALYSPHQNRYSLLSGVDLYPAAGTQMDWMYGETGALSYVIELRPRSGRGKYGFVLPPEEIRPTCDEGLAAVLALRGAR